MNTADVIGWLGTLIVLSAYALVATGRYDVRLFHWANALGAPLIATSAIAHSAWPALAVTVTFGVIGAVSLVCHWDHP